MLRPMTTSAVIEPVEATAEVDNDDSDTDMHHSSVTAALTKAQQVFKTLWKCHRSDATASRQGAVV